MALKTWEMSNSVESVSSMDEIYRYDENQQKAIQSAKPWEKEFVCFFLLYQRQRISTSMLIQISNLKTFYSFQNAFKSHTL